MDQDAARQLIAGIIWVAFTFTGLIGIGKSFTTELQNDCLESLQMSPVPKGAIYLGKVTANFLFMFAVEILLFPLFVIFFNLEVVRSRRHATASFLSGDIRLIRRWHTLFRLNGANPSQGGHASRLVIALGGASHDRGR